MLTAPHRCRYTSMTFPEKKVYVATIFGGAFFGQLLLSDSGDYVWNTVNKGFALSLGGGGEREVRYQPHLLNALK
jgi:hypothetical protein